MSRLYGRKEFAQLEDSIVSTDFIVDYSAFYANVRSIYGQCARHCAESPRRTTPLRCVALPPLRDFSLQKLLNHELQLVQSALAGAQAGASPGQTRPSRAIGFVPRAYCVCAAMKRGKIKMECHGCRTRGAGSAVAATKGRGVGGSDSGQRHPDTIAFIVRLVSTSRFRCRCLFCAAKRAYSARSDTHSATELGLGTGFNSLRARLSFVRSCARSGARRARIVRSFHLTRSRALALPSPSTVRYCDSTSGPLGVPHSNCHSLARSARLGSSFGCTHYSPRRVPSLRFALFGVFHQHISCLSLSDENYVDDVCTHRALR